MLSGGTAFSAGTPPDVRSLIHECALRVSPDLRGLEALSADCPHIAAAIRDLGVAAFLPDGWQRRLDARQLADVDALLARYAGTPLQALPDPVSLKEIAQHLAVPAVPPPSLWERLGRWVRNWLEKSGWADWLRSLFRWHLMAGESEVLLYGMVLLVVLAVGGVIANEVRASGVRTERRRSTRRAYAQPPTATGEPADIANVPIRLQPVVLLRSLVVALSRSERLAHERDLTCRELITAARFDTSAQREGFARIALLAERALYGDPGLFPQPLGEDVIAGAQGLASQLLAPPQAQHTGA